MTDQAARRGRRVSLWVMWLVLAAAVALLLPLRDVDVSVTVYGVEVAVWLLAVAFYTLGLAAGWASLAARRA